MAKARRSKTGEPNPPDSVNDTSMLMDPNSAGEERLSGRSSERIAERAYELYLARGGSDGQDFDDWLAAERELSSGPSQDARPTESPQDDRSE
jgi:hypothetical protein